jgi:diguanylate cyclase (GGDEF)-like protein/PAS domain S-box-containing protein
MMSIGTIILELVQNMSLFAAVVVGYTAIRRRADLAGWVSDLLIGLVFGAGTVLAMSLTIQLAPGVILDGRSVLTGSIAFFAGPLGSVLALLIAGIYRYSIGGAGSLGGVLGVAAAGLIGQAFLFAVRRRVWRQGPLLFFALGLSVVSGNMVVYFLLHLHNAMPLPDGLFVALFAAIPVGTMILAVMLRREDARLLLQQQLAEQTALFETIFQSMSDGVTVADARGDIILANAMSMKLSGVQPGELSRKEWVKRFNVFLPDGETSFPMDRLPLSRAVKGEATDDVEMIIEDKEGEFRRRRLSLSGRPLRDARGQSRGGVVVFHDNTEQHEMQENLRRSEERFSLAISGSRDGIFDYNPVTREAWFSPRYKAILGYTDAQFPNDIRFWKSRMLPEDHKASTAQFFDYEQGRIDTIEIRQRFRHRDGSIIHVQNRAQGVRDEHGRITRLVGAITDVTPLIKAEQRLKDAIGAMESGFALFDSEDRLVICNDGFIDPATRSRFGVPIGHSFEEIFSTFAEGRLTAVHSRNNPETWMAWRLEMHRHPPKEPLEIQWTDGRWMRVTERRTADGGSVGIWTDITLQKAAESRLRDAIDSINEGFALFDKHLRFVICNQRFREQYPISAEAIRPGISLADVLRHGALGGEFIEATTPAEIDAFVEQWMQRYNCSFPFVEEVENKEQRWYLISHQRTATGGFVTLRTDITTQKRREQELQHTQDKLERQQDELERYVADVEAARARIEKQAAEQVTLLQELNAAQAQTQRAHQEVQQAANVLRSMADSLPALVADVDADGYYRYCNNSYLEFFGYKSEDIIGRHVRDVYGADFLAATVASDMAWVMEGQEVAFRRGLQAGGRARQIEGKYIPQIDASGKVNGFFMSAWDVTEQYEREQRLNLEVSTDALTGMLNRRAILTSIQDLPSRLASGLVGAAVLYLDIDHFKNINDTLGHAAGDQLLKVFAQRLRQTVRASDLVARLGGDEFVILLVDVADPAVAERVAQQIVTRMGEVVMLGGKSIQISTSIGVAYRRAGSAGEATGLVTSPDETQTGETQKGQAQMAGAQMDLLAEADAALYQAKAAGRNTYRLHGGNLASIAQ